MSAIDMDRSPLELQAQTMPCRTLNPTLDLYTDNGNHGFIKGTERVSDALQALYGNEDARAQHSRRRWNKGPGRTWQRRRELAPFWDEVQATMMGALVQPAERPDGGDGSYWPVDDHGYSTDAKTATLDACYRG